MDSDVGQLLGRKFSDAIVTDGRGKYAITPKDGDSVALQIGSGGISIRSLLAIVEHKMLGVSVMPVDSSASDRVLAAARTLSDHWDEKVESDVASLVARAASLDADIKLMTDAMTAAQDAAGSEKYAQPDANPAGDK